MPFGQPLFSALVGVREVDFGAEACISSLDYFARGLQFDKDFQSGVIMSKLLDNYDKYKRYTEQKDWPAICEMQGITMRSCRFGTMKEMSRLPEQLQPEEVVFCFTAGVMSNKGDSNASDFGMSTWLVALTDRRFLFLDAAMLSNSIDVHSILHKNVQAVRVAQGMILGKINIDTGGRTTLIDNCEKNTVKILGDLANEWLQVLEERHSSPRIIQTVAHAETGESGLDKLKKLGELKALGLVTEDEFNIAKTKVLASL